MFFRHPLRAVQRGSGARAVWQDWEGWATRTEYHVRHAALPAPGEEAQLRALAGRLFAQRLDRGKPLWESWLVEGFRDRPGHDGRAGRSRPAWAQG